jgi:hypothetical protein
MESHTNSGINLKFKKGIEIEEKANNTAHAFEMHSTTNAEGSAF